MRLELPVWRVKRGDYIEDCDACRERLSGFVFRSGLVMKPVFERARAAPKRTWSRRRSRCAAS